MITDGDEIEFVIVSQKPDNELSRTFKDDPTIEHYLKLRTENPKKEIEVAVTGGMDWLLANDQLLQDNGIKPKWMAAALDADDEAINHISLTLLQKLADRKKLLDEGATQIASRGIAVSNSFVNYLIAIMLDALSWNNRLEIPRDLIVLTRYQLLGTEVPAIKKRQEAHELKSSVEWVAAQLLERQEKISMRKIAKILGVNVSTISRMFSDNELEEKAFDHLESFKMVAKSDSPFADLTTRHLNEMGKDE